MKKEELILIVLALALSFFIFPSVSAQEIDTNLTIPNSAPQLIQNIPDITWAKNTDLINWIDLDDYFTDYEDTLTFSIISPENITIIIDPVTNTVSLYPDTNFTGSRIVYFNASDGLVSTQSNAVTLTVTGDTIAPQWSNVEISSDAISQSDFVTFSANWTDNVQLYYYILSINQGLGYVNSSNILFSGTQNVSSITQQISAGPGTTVYWKIYAVDTSLNINVTNTQSFVVVSPTIPPSGGGGGSSSGGGGSSSSSDDGGTPTYGNVTGTTPGLVPPLDQRRIETYDFAIEPLSYFVTLKQTEHQTVFTKITNIGSENLSMNLSLKNLDTWVEIEKKTTFLDIGASEAIAINIHPTERTNPDLYQGSLFIESRAGNVSIPITIEVKPLTFKASIEVEILDEYRSVRPEQVVLANITINSEEDLLEKDGTLYLALRDYGSLVLDSSQEDIKITEREISFIRELTVPGYTSPGGYIFFGRINIEDELNLDSDLFEVGERFNVFSFIRLNLIILLIILLTLISLYLLDRYRRYKKRTKLLNLYLESTELKDLIEAKKTDEALELFIRIKNEYGEAVKITALDNKEKLKEEMQKFYNEMQKMENRKPPVENKTDEGEKKKVVEEKPAEEKEKVVEEKPEEEIEEEKNEGDEPEKKKEEIKPTESEEKTKESKEDNSEEIKPEEKNKTSRKEIKEEKPAEEKKDDKKE